MGAARPAEVAEAAAEPAAEVAELRREAAEEAAELMAPLADEAAETAADEADSIAPLAAELAETRTLEAWLAADPVSEPKTVLKPVVVGTAEPAEFVTVPTRGMVVTALWAAEPSEPVTEAATDAREPVADARAPVKMGSAAGTLEAPAKSGIVVSGARGYSMDTTYLRRDRRRRRRQKRTRRHHRLDECSHGCRRPSWTWCRSSSGHQWSTGSRSAQWWPCC